jgi:hypothetical protein
MLCFPFQQQGVVILFPDPEPVLYVLFSYLHLQLSLQLRFFFLSERVMGGKRDRSHGSYPVRHADLNEGCVGDAKNDGWPP